MSGRGRTRRVLTAGEWIVCSRRTEHWPILHLKVVRLPEFDRIAPVQNGGALLAHCFPVPFRRRTEESRISYEELESRARTIAAALAPQAAPGDRALLFYSAGIEFIAAFWGCVYAGVVAVPVFPARLHRQIPRLLSIVADSGARCVLTTAKMRRQAEDLFKRAPELKKLLWLSTDDLPAAHEDEWEIPGSEPRNIGLFAIHLGLDGRAARRHGVARKPAA